MFNLQKYSQKGIEFFDTSLQDLDSQVKEEPQIDQKGLPPTENQTISEISRSLTSDQESAAKQAATATMANGLIAEILKGEQGQEILNRLKSEPEFANFVTQIRRDADPAFLKGFVEENQISGLIKEFEQTSDMQSMSRSIKARAEAIARQMNVNQSNMNSNFFNQQKQLPVAAFNLKNHKKAQVVPIENTDRKSNFITQYLPRILSFTGDKNQDVDVEAAKSEIIRMCSPAAQEEVNSALERIQGLNSHVGQEEGKKVLEYVYDNWVSPFSAIGLESMNPMEKTMQKDPKGIIKHDLSSHVLNNKTAMTKTAADHFGNPYILYGPSEKRICPKLRGKGGGQSGSGDVVSEYVCRHHCLDGIVIDDNKTVCGEAIFRAHVMDKFSRDYVDADGNIQGGYLNKRFEIHRDVPEENKMRLKPGETRKPRPPEWGSTESRMQAMRAAEGEKRGYRPETNTAEPFKWCSDVDQNNVEVSQKERNRRETASGHKIVEYTNKNKQENNPKKAFNLKTYKTAQGQNVNDDSGVYESPSPKIPNQMVVDMFTSSSMLQRDVEEIAAHLNTNATNRNLSDQDWNIILNTVNKDLQNKQSNKRITKKDGVVFVAEVRTDIEDTALKQKIERLFGRAAPTSPPKGTSGPGGTIDTFANKSFNLKSFKTAQMNRSRRPFGEDEPQLPSAGAQSFGDDRPGNRFNDEVSDDLGLSPDMYGREDYDDDLNSGAELSMSPEAEEIISQIYGMTSKDELVNFLNQALKSSSFVNHGPSSSGYSGSINPHDLDDITDAANDHLRQLGENGRIETNGETFGFIPDQTNEFDMGVEDDIDQHWTKDEPSDWAKDEDLFTKPKPMMGNPNPPAIAPTSPMLSSVAKKSFNFTRYKQAQMIPIPDDGRKIQPIDSPTRDPKPMSSQDFETVKFPFDEGAERISKMSNDALLHTLKELNEVIEIQEKSSREENPTPKLGYYLDERHAILGEMKRRGLSSNPSPVKPTMPSSSVNSLPLQGLGNPTMASSFNMKQFKKAQKTSTNPKDKMKKIHDKITGLRDRLETTETSSTEPCEGCSRSTKQSNQSVGSSLKTAWWMGDDSGSAVQEPIQESMHEDPILDEYEQINDPNAKIYCLTCGRENGTVLNMRDANGSPKIFCSPECKSIHRQRLIDSKSEDIPSVSDYDSNTSDDDLDNPRMKDLEMNPSVLKKKI